MNEAIISVNNVSFCYGKKQVLHEVSFEIRKGKITTILGQNGSGKSTLFSLLTKHRTLKQGNITIEGKSIKDFSIRQYARLAASVSQYNTVLHELTVRELVAYGRLPYYCTKEQEKDAYYIDRAIALTKLEEIQEEQVANLSGGQMQRVWIAMAIAQNTKLLFLDEPTTYLDVFHQLELLKLIRRLNEECQMTIVMILHDINQALHYSDDIVALKEGRLIQSGEAGQVVNEALIETLYGVKLDMLESNSKKYVMTI